MIARILYWVFALLCLICGMAQFARGDYAMSLASLALAEINALHARLEV